MKLFFRICTLTVSLFALWLIYQKDLGISNGIINYVAAWPNGDKVGHFFLFGFLSFCAVLATNFKKASNSRYVPIYLASLVVCIIVILEECSHLLFKTRTFEIADIMANILGIMTFSYIAYGIDSVYKLSVMEQQAESNQ
ncbi:VanZ family protein [Psychrosphaera sp. B3R10]|uniref:VanZ family protein n=1 Tax=unclassified Psychrosphaera TaxID=2641570 RepID=UPI001C084987|nr:MULTISPECIES: VanZ family protein [unclassified Psychrosphaera]MBU2883098.1 VanZ family protein [Psychrosphaera sp. I2R16]MBU2988555.1 VanZ family protein [Psychrosphaera sp. B3R10]